MKDKRIKKIILWTIVIAYTLWIFHNSAQTGKVSANLSQTLSYRTIEERQQKRVIILWMILVPIIDEGIQYFTPGRSAELRDCIIDMCGYGFGFLITYLIKQRKTK